MIIRRQQEILDEILRSKNPKAVMAVLVTCFFDELEKKGETEELRRLGHAAIGKSRKLRKEQKTPGKKKAPGKNPRNLKEKARSQTTGTTSGV